MNCAYCGEPIDGGPGGYWSTVTTFEVCDGDSPTSFHEPKDSITATPQTGHDPDENGSSSEGQQ